MKLNILMLCAASPHTTSKYSPHIPYSHIIVLHGSGYSSVVEAGLLDDNHLLRRGPVRLIFDKDGPENQDDVGDQAFAPFLSPDLDVLNVGGYLRQGGRFDLLLDLHLS